MSDTKGTPGPWRAEQDGDASFDIFNQHGELIVTVFPMTSGPDAMAANAKLISHAPELYEAWEMAKKYLEPDLVEPGRTVFWNLVQAMHNARGEDDPDAA